MIKDELIRTWIEVDTAALRHNFDVFRKIINTSCKLMAVCKSNAYGHDLIQYGKFQEKLGTDFLGVDSFVEARSLRREKIKIPILVLGYALPEALLECQKNDISVTISSLDQLNSALKQPVKQLKIHLKIDTGMHRQGFSLPDLEQALELINHKRDRLFVEGVYTHLASAKNPAFPSDTISQLQIFEKACQLLAREGFSPIRHAAASSATLIYSNSHFDMVRVGASLMGMWPSYEVMAYCQGKYTLKPALKWYTIISEIKDIKKGEGIGYDFTEILDKDSRIAILPIGYWHGYRRSLSSIGRVLIGNTLAKVVGRVSMDMVIVDVTDIMDIKVGDIVLLMGESNSGVTVYDFARLSDTSWYEVITQLNPLIKRIYI